jgi:hypothetical protein
MVLCIAAATLADSGFRVGLGLGKLDNETKLDVGYNDADASGKLLSPGNDYLLELNYDANDKLSYTLNYDYGKETLGSLSYNKAEATLKSDYNVLTFESKYQWKLGSCFKTGAIVGYSDSERNLKLNVDLGGSRFSGKIKQESHSLYLGGQVSCFAIKNLAGRYMLDPTDKMTLHAKTPTGSESYSLDLTDYGDYTSYKIDFYGIANLTEKWSLKVDYCLNYSKFDLDTINNDDDSYSGSLKSTISQLTAMLRYKF